MEALSEETNQDLNVMLERYLEHRFKASAMNVCQTQPLTKMNVDKMTVEFKKEALKAKPIRTSRIIPIPLSLRD